MLIKIVIFFLLASLIASQSGKIAQRILAINRLAPRNRRLSEERQHTLRLLVGNTVAGLAFIIAILASLALFVPADTIVWIVGLFGTAFGLAARPMVSDILAGLSFIFNETFDVGEKVEFMVQMSNIQGVVENINLTSSQLRAPTGELYTIPNGEIRVVRNFSRGKFSMVTISFSVSTEDLARSLDALKALGDDVYNGSGELVEPWQVMNNSSVTGGRVELTILAKAVFGKAPDVKLSLTNRIFDCFKQENIAIM